MQRRNFLKLPFVCSYPNNLLTNAIKYSPEAERIIIHLTSTAKHLTVSIQDFGIGIPTTEQEKVFERFYRVAAKHRQTTAGLGIGLSIAHQIIEHYEAIRGYCKDEQGAPISTTESYVALKLFIENWRWADVPFYIRTGKSLPARITEPSRCVRVPIPASRDQSSTGEQNE